MKAIHIYALGDFQTYFILQELFLDRSSLLEILTEIIMSGDLEAQLNMIEQYISVTAERKANNLASFNKWINCLTQN